MLTLALARPCVRVCVRVLSAPLLHKMRLIQRRRRSGLTPPSICVVFCSVSPARPAAGDHQRAPFAGLKRELTPVSWGKMARCSKAIFRVRWGLSESGLMAAGDLPALLGASHRKTATGVSPIAHPVLLQRRKAAVWRRKYRPGVEEKMPRFVPANPDREETSQGQGAPLRTLEADLPSPGREERGTPRRERAQRLF